jgi:hypothetical protein
MISREPQGIITAEGRGDSETGRAQRIRGDTAENCKDETADETIGPDRAGARR